MVELRAADWFEFMTRLARFPPFLPRHGPWLDRPSAVTPDYFSGAMRCGPSLVYFSTLLALASLMKRFASSWRRNRNCISSAAACSTAAT
jgi:hypothetical protein